MVCFLPRNKQQQIECLEAVNNFDDILAESDAIMVARGDLGVEMPMEQVQYDIN